MVNAEKPGLRSQKSEGKMVDTRVRKAKVEDYVRNELLQKFGSQVI